MTFKTADVKGEYAKNKDLHEEDVKVLKEWMEKQPHLPTITDLQLIIFLQSCYCRIEMAKTTIDTFFTVKTLCPELFANRDPTTSKMQAGMEVGCYQPLPKLTKEGYRVIFCRIMDPDSSKYVYTEQLKIFDMSMMLWLMQEGTEQGLIIVMDMDTINFGHLTKLTVMTMKKFLYYLQEAMPVRLKGLHFINVVSFMDKIMALMKPFMKKELMEMLHLHTESKDSLYKFVPQDCLPKDIGGSADSFVDLHALMKKRLTENSDYFEAEMRQLADESKRQGKPKNAGDIFGVEGTFKKLDID